jgi:hypothetical protein
MFATLRALVNNAWNRGRSLTRTGLDRSRLQQPHLGHVVRRIPAGAKADAPGTTDPAAAQVFTTRIKRSFSLWPTG